MDVYPEEQEAHLLVDTAPVTEEEEEDTDTDSDDSGAEPRPKRRLTTAEVLHEARLNPLIVDGTVRPVGLLTTTDIQRTGLQPRSAATRAEIARLREARDALTIALEHLRVTILLGEHFATAHNYNDPLAIGQSPQTSPVSEEDRVPARDVIILTGSGQTVHDVRDPGVAELLREERSALKAETLSSATTALPRDTPAESAEDQHTNVETAPATTISPDSV